MDENDNARAPLGAAIDDFLASLETVETGGLHLMVAVWEDGGRVVKLAVTQQTRGELRAALRRIDQRVAETRRIAQFAAAKEIIERHADTMRLLALGPDHPRCAVCGCPLNMKDDADSLDCGGICRACLLDGAE